MVIDGYDDDLRRATSGVMFRGGMQRLGTYVRLGT